jgi:hypothetical protein
LLLLQLPLQLLELLQLFCLLLQLLLQHLLLLQQLHLLLLASNCFRPLLLTLPLALLIILLPFCIPSQTPTHSITGVVPFHVHTCLLCIQKRICSCFCCSYQLPCI